MEMRSLDILGFIILPVLGTYGIVFSVRFFLPCNTIRHVSAALNQVELLVNRVEAINRIPNASEYRTNLAILADQLSRFRMESHRSPGFFSQLRLVLQSGLTCRLYALSSRIEAMRLKVELVVDEQQLTLATLVHDSIINTLPAPAAVTATPIINVAQPIAIATSC